MFTLHYTYEGKEHSKGFALASDARHYIAEWSLTDYRLHDGDGKFLEGRSSL